MITADVERMTADEALRCIAANTMPCADCDQIHRQRVLEVNADGTIRRETWAAEDGHPYRPVAPKELAKRVLKELAHK